MRKLSDLKELGSAELDELKMLRPARKRLERALEELKQAAGDPASQRRRLDDGRGSAAPAEKPSSPPTYHPILAVMRPTHRGWPDLRGTSPYAWGHGVDHAASQTA